MTSRGLPQSQTLELLLETVVPASAPNPATSDCSEVQIRLQVWVEAISQGNCEKINYLMYVNEL